MKRYFLFTLIMTAVIRLSFAQATADNAVPQPVLAKFSSSYAKVKVRSWCQQENAWVVKFKSDGRVHKAYYTPEGIWQKTETKYGFTHSLLPRVKAGWQSCSYAGWYIDEIMELETPAEHVYRFQVDNGPMLDVTHMYNFKEYRRLYFAANGNFIKAEKFPQ